MKPIYLDNASTTKTDDAVIKAMAPYFGEKYGNAASVHIMGQTAKDAVSESRNIIAKSIGAKPDEIIFTSGGTESNNFVLKGLFFSNPQSHIITTKTEHPSVLNTCRWLEEKGARVTYLDVNREGFVDLAELENSIAADTALISIIHANNEIGTIQNIEEIGKICKKRKIYFHADACQSYTKIPIDVNAQNLDFMTLNAHKIHGPKGVGALYVRSGIKITPLSHGGEHEQGLRSGTENTAGIVGFGKSVQISSGKDAANMAKLRDMLIEGALKIPRVKLNGPREQKNRLCNNVNLTFTGFDAETLAGYLEGYGIYCSMGSACLSQTHKTSHVLAAVGLTEIEAKSTLRFSLSKYTTAEEIKYTLEALAKILKKM